MQHFAMPRHIKAIQCHATPYQTRQRKPRHTTTYHAMPCNAMPCHASHPTPCHVMQFLSCNAIPCNAMQCHATPRHYTPCNAIQCHATPYHTMKYNPMPYKICHITPKLAQDCSYHVPPYQRNQLSQNMSHCTQNWHNTGATICNHTKLSICREICRIAPKIGT